MHSVTVFSIWMSIFTSETIFLFLCRKTMWHDFWTLILSDRLRIVSKRILSITWRACAVGASYNVMHFKRLFGAMGSVLGTGAKSSSPKVHPYSSTSNDGVTRSSQSLRWIHARSECCDADAVMEGLFSGFISPAAVRLLNASNRKSPKPFSDLPLNSILNISQTLVMISFLWARLETRSWIFHSSPIDTVYVLYFVY